jgi:hypothetical protein
MTHVDVEYKTIVTANPDEADSLAGYLNEHGVFATVNTAEHSVSALSDDTETDELIRTLKRTWRKFWDNSDSGLYGLPMFIKSD